jgi:hypothetical protein
MIIPIYHIQILIIIIISKFHHYLLSNFFPNLNETL